MAGGCADALFAREFGAHSYFAFLQAANLDGLHESARDAGARITRTPAHHDHS